MDGVASPWVSSAEQRRLLLIAATTAIRRELGLTVGDASAAGSIQGTFGGAFVTLWRGKTLRGCVGNLTATEDIVQAVRSAARAAIKDSRFAAAPVTAEELPAITTEVSVLSALERTGDPGSLTPGVHGIVVRKGSRSGCFLPKVASDRGWTAEEFLDNCCEQKAGLAPDAWRAADVEVWLFTADVFDDQGVA